MAINYKLEQVVDYVPDLTFNDLMHFAHNVRSAIEDLGAKPGEESTLDYAYALLSAAERISRRACEEKAAEKAAAAIARAEGRT